MMYGSRDWYRLALLTAVALLVGWLIAAPGYALFLGAVVVIAWQHRQFALLTRWVERPLRSPGPPDTPWQRVALRLHRALRRARRRSRRAIEQLHDVRNVTRALPDAAVVIDGEGAIIDFNDAARGMLRLTRADRGRSLAALLRHPDVVELLAERATTRIVEIASPFADQQRLELRRFAAGEDYDLILVRDVSQLNRLLSMRQDFVANVSHELRTPLTVLIGYLETADDSLGDAELRELVAKLRSPTRRMQLLVDDLLLLTRLEANPPPAEDDLQVLEMRVVIDRAIEDALALSRGAHEIHRHIKTDAKLLGIESEIHSALSNLLTNAVRYSPDGGRIDVSWSNDEHGAILEARDQGMGIAPEHLKRLTERFYRVDLAGERARGGTGLGLAITKHVLQRHDSSLMIESEVGRGSRFYCVFPPSQLRYEPRPALNNDTRTR
jgi:two-component system phosphate regulon sensor histidine kinase PhoR